LCVLRSRALKPTLRLRRSRRVAEIAQDQTDDEVEHGGADEGSAMLEDRGAGRDDPLRLENADQRTNNRNPTDKGNNQPPVRRPDIMRQHQCHAREQTDKAGEIQPSRAADKFRQAG